MLNPESVKKYFGQADLWELRKHLLDRIGRGNNDHVEIGINELCTLLEQALWPAWFHGHLIPEGMLVVLEPRQPEGCPEYGAVSFDEDGSHVDTYGCMTNREMMEYLEQVKDGELIPASLVVEFVMSNPALMKGLRYWVKQRRNSKETPDGF